jgi:O-antigen ligase
MVGVPIMIMSAKTVQITLPLLLAGACAWAISCNRLDSLKPQFGSASLALSGLILFAVLSGLWASIPWAAVSISLVGAIVLAGSSVLIAFMRTQDRASALHMAEGLWVGLLVGLLYMIAEAASGQAIKIWAYNLLGLGPLDLNPAQYFTWDNGVLVAVHEDDLTRNIVPAPLLVWPALMAANQISATHWRKVVIVLLVLMSVAAVMLATSETAKLALIAGVIAFGLAHLSTRVTRYLLSGAWVLACLGVVPASHLAYALDLQNAEWLQLSGQLRITLWNEIAGLVPKAPVLGVGADMTYYLNPVMRDVPAAVASLAGKLSIPHPHNVYLQTWYELGGVGAVLLTAFGLLLLARVARLPNTLQPFAFALFATGAVQIVSSYNMWQIWFMCLFGFATAMFALAEGLERWSAVTPRIQA